MLVWLVAVLHLQQASALYHTSSEILHWFSHCAAKRPDTLRSVLPVTAVVARPSSSLGCRQFCRQS